MKTTAIATIWFVFLSAVAVSAQYVGYEYEGVLPNAVLPNGVRHLGGAMISDVNADPAYGISQVSKGRTRMLWLEVSTGQDAGGVTGWRVLDVLSFPALSRSQHLLIAFDPAVECLRGGKPVERLVAFGTIRRRQGIYEPQRAWIADIQKKRFSPISIRNLRCTYSEP